MQGVLSNSLPNMVEKPSIISFMRVWNTPMAFLGLMLRPYRLPVEPIGTTFVSEMSCS